MRLFQKANGIWSVDFVDPGGTRRRVSTGERDYAAAFKQGKRLATGRVEPIVDRAPEPTTAPRPRPATATTAWTMDALWTHCERTVWHPRECRSQATILSNLKILRTVIVTLPDSPKPVRFADLNPTMVRKLTLDALSAALFDRGYASATVKRKVDMVGRSLAVAVDLEIITGRPKMPTINGGKPRERVITEAEEAVVFAVVDCRTEDEPGRPWRRYGHLLRFLMDTACRLGEALALRRTWIDETPQGWVLNIPASTTKNGKGRSIPLTPAIVESLPFLEANASTDGRLFPLSAGTAQYFWRENVVPDCKLAGIDLSDAVLHTFRHTKLTRLAKLADFGIHRVSTWAGHSDISITAKVYAKLDVNDLWGGVA
jgi:integrase